MAKYQRQGTNKYYGAGNAGYVSSGSSADGLAKSLTNAGYKIGEAENLRIDRKKDEAIAKIDELYATGKSFETIQAEIISGKHKELTGKYIEATTNYHAGRVKAHEVINTIKKAKIDDGYDISDESMSLELFYKKHMPDTKSMDTSTLLGFTTQFNKFRHADAIEDAEARGRFNSEEKVRKGAMLLDDIPTENIKNELSDFITGLQIKVPNGDGSNTPNLLHTNAETLAIIRRSIVDIIANAKTETDLNRADVLLNTNLGYSKNGSAIGTIASRKSKEILIIQDKLEKKRRALIINDRTEKSEDEKQLVRDVNAAIFEQVEYGTSDGVQLRDKTYAEKMELRDQLEEIGVASYVENFDRLMNNNTYIDTDPEVYNQLVSSIYDGEFTSQEEISKAINELNIDPRLLSPTLSLFESWSKSSTKQGSVHTTNTTYKEGLKYIESAVRGNYTSNGILKENGNKAIRNAHNYMKKELYDFEFKYAQDNDGKQPSTFEREEFLKKMGDIVIEKFVEGTGGDPTMKTMTEYEEDIKTKQAEKDAKDAKYEAAGVSETTEAIAKALDDARLEIPAKVKEALDKFDSNIFGFGFGLNDENFGKSESEDRQTFANEKIPSVVADILKDVPITMEVIEAMETSDFNSLKEQIAKAIQAGTNKALGSITTQQIDQALQLIIKRGS
ncbi:hypothetical protein I902_gp36 [Pelagibacter phage HTVC019P]|uniref:Uncharacterized protein n=1 Tax=Pelagibacter phage HTVC019P TaxID=1283079 RepID=M1HMB8_9CAUD|nr:hypothetical protein I902_gp36 [Pelagibacter phage HTVC019P]AGE60613.1 hypothetical protein [Pelagibacter phage HTVC019P]